MRDDLLIPRYNTNVLPLRWLVDKFFHPISMFFFNVALRMNDSDSGSPALEKACWKMYTVLGYPYDKYGTFYELRPEILEAFKQEVGGWGWDDYDEFGVPYWDYLWHEDPVTGDAWRIKVKDDTAN
mgnify:CR=1 FL=1